MNLELISEISTKDLTTADEQRKSSLPSNVKLNTGPRAKDWLKDNKWLKQPEEGIVEIEKVQKLKNWLEKSSESENIEDLKLILDWDNNKPSRNDAKTGKIIDPYNPIRGEQYFIQVSKILVQYNLSIVELLIAGKFSSINRISSIQLVTFC